MLIVDDEPGALKALKYLLDWESYGFEVAGEAANGREALDRLAEDEFSLIVTDIRMPGIDGLELIRRVRELSGIPILVMSGFEEFEYVKACLKFGIKDYLLKPVAEEDLGRLLQDVREDLNRVRKLNRQLYHGMKAMRDQVLRQWASGAMRTQDAEERFRLTELPLDPSRHAACCLLVEMDFMDETDVFLTDGTIQVLRFAVRNIMEEIVGDGGCVFELTDQRFGILLYEERDRLTAEDVLSVADGVQVHVTRYAKVSVTIGIGDIVWPASSIPRSFAVAEKMLDRKFFAGGNAVIWKATFDEETPGEGTRELQPLLDAVACADEKQVHLLLKRQMERFAAGGARPAQVRSYMLELFVNLFHLLMKEGVRAESLFRDGGGSLAALEAKTISQLFAYAQTKCTEAIALRAASQSPQPVTTVEAIKRIVDAEYGSGTISLKAISEQIYMNPAYLGQLFKSAEGMSFNDYLLRVRMEKAKELLRKTDKKVLEVAMDVGYRELNWFYKKFKEYTGVSTSEFRAVK
ncbi:response regulator [Cohnella zeiphila]|uniref:response regulator n=1 Tax=Cohnella zeiphila TaxID=2761120 RepID=UPI00308042F0